MIKKIHHMLNHITNKTKQNENKTNADIKNVLLQNCRSIVTQVYLD